MNTLELLNIAEIQLSYSTKVKASDRPKITCSRNAYELFLPFYNEGQIELCEFFKVMVLNRANQVLGILNLSQGGTSGTVADPKLIFVAALKAHASGIILSHNHPSGQLQPSQADLSLTTRLKQGGALLDIPVLDHIILTKDSYLSFADEGLL